MTRTLAASASNVICNKEGLERCLCIFLPIPCYDAQLLCFMQNVQGMVA